MEVVVEKKPIINAKLMLDEFKKEMNKHFDLEKAINKSLKIIKCEGVDEDQTRKLLLLNINWGRIIMFYNKSDKKTMDINVFVSEVKDVIRYEPKTFDTKTNVFKFKERIVSETQTLTIHTFIPLMEHHVETMLADTIFDYGEKTWTKIIDLE